MFNCSATCRRAEVVLKPTLNLLVNPREILLQ